MLQGFTEPSNDDNILEVVAVLGASQMVRKFLVQFVVCSKLNSLRLLSEVPFLCPPEPTVLCWSAMLLSNIAAGELAFF